MIFVFLGCISGFFSPLRVGSSPDASPDPKDEAVPASPREDLRNRAATGKLSPLPAAPEASSPRKCGEGGSPASERSVTCGPRRETRSAHPGTLPAPRIGPSGSELSVL